ncbi:MAG: hypothetical protein ACLUPK_08780 [Veillonella sp.]
MRCIKQQAEAQRQAAILAEQQRQMAMQAEQQADCTATSRSSTSSCFKSGTRAYR